MGLKRLLEHIWSECTAANGISAMRPVLAIAGAVTLDGMLLSMAMAGVAGLDAVDGYVARRKGPSRLGGNIDNVMDYAVEVVVLSAYVVNYDMPMAVPALVAARDIAVCYLGTKDGGGRTSFRDDRWARGVYGVVKACAFCAVPVATEIGMAAVYAMMGISLYRGVEAARKHKGA